MKVLFALSLLCATTVMGQKSTVEAWENMFNGKDLNDSGRAVISKNKVDRGKFKTPGLRNVAITAPYMHNGKFATLEQVVDYYNEPNKLMPNAVNRDTLIKSLGLNSEEKSALVAFLKALTDKRFLK